MKEHKVKKFISIGILSIGLFLTFSGCSSTKSSDMQVDKVEIYTTHYISGDAEQTFTDEETVKKYVDFFNKLDFDNPAKGEHVSEYDGGGWDYITFKRQDEIVSQYVIYGREFICKDVNSVKEALEMDNFQERCEKLDSLEWYAISEDNHTQWQTYIQDLFE